MLITDFRRIVFVFKRRLIFSHLYKNLKKKMSVRVLCPVLAVKAKEELGEDPERIKDSVENIKEWVKKQPHLCDNIRIDDQWIVMFLRGCKYSIERAKKKLENYNTYRVLYSDFILSVDPMRPDIQKILQAGFFVPCRTTKTVVGKPELLLYRLPVLKDLDVSVENSFRISTMISTILAVECDNFTISGQVLIYDVNIDAKSAVAFMSPSTLKKIILIAQDAWPIRQKGMHLVNVNPKWESAISIAKIFMNEKNRNRIFFHKDPSTLKDHIPIEQLPKEYGGTGGTLREYIDYWKQKTESYRDWISEDVKYKSNESRRIQTNEDLPYDMKGSFRKLDLD